jgi:hypothetical protein
VIHIVSPLLREIVEEEAEKARREDRRDATEKLSSSSLWPDSTSRHRT